MHYNQRLHFMHYRSKMIENKNSTPRHSIIFRATPRRATRQSSAPWDCVGRAKTGARGTRRITRLAPWEPGLRYIRYVKRNMYNARRKTMPALPKSIDEVHEVLGSMEILTNRNTNFLIVNDRQEKIIIFSCDTNLKTFCASKYIYVDGTFSYCAKYFKQMFTILMANLIQRRHLS